ncbi:MAG: RNA polymerase sigma factor [Tepidisphaerales bacterium]
MGFPVAAIADRYSLLRGALPLFIQDLVNSGRADDAPQYILVSDFARFALHDLEAPSCLRAFVPQSLSFPIPDRPVKSARFLKARTPASFKMWKSMPGSSPERFEDVFSRYAGKLALYARQWVDAQTAEDVVQEVFVSLAGMPRPPELVGAWLYRCVRNASISQVRSEARRRRREEAARPAEWFVAQADDPIDAQAAQEALARLAIQQREIVVLRIWGELTFAQIAELIERPLASVFVEYRAALAALRERLESPCRKKTD